MGLYSDKQYPMYMNNGTEITRRAKLTKQSTDWYVEQNVLHALLKWAVQDRLSSVQHKPLGTANHRTVPEDKGDAARNREAMTIH